MLQTLADGARVKWSLKTLGCFDARSIISFNLARITTWEAVTWAKTALLHPSSFNPLQFPSNFHVITFPLFDLTNECLCMFDVAALCQPITRIELAVGVRSLARIRRDVPPLEQAASDGGEFQKQLPVSVPSESTGGALRMNIERGPSYVRRSIKGKTRSHFHRGKCRTRSWESHTRGRVATNFAASIRTSKSSTQRFALFSALCMHKVTLFE